MLTPRVACFAMLILGMLAAEEETTVDFGMERFYAATKHFGPAGKFGNVFDGNAGIAKEFCSATG